MLLEDFKNSLPDGVIMFSNEQKVMSMSKAAVVADEFLLTDKNVFTPFSRPGKPAALYPAQLESSCPSSRPVRLPSPPRGER